MREPNLISKKGLTKNLINGYSILNGAKYSVEDGSRYCLVFQLLFTYFQVFTGSGQIFAWKYKRLSGESFKITVTSNWLLFIA